MRLYRPHGDDAGADPALPPRWRLRRRFARGLRHPAALAGAALGLAGRGRRLPAGPRAPLSRRAGRLLRRPSRPPRRSRAAAPSGRAARRRRRQRRRPARHRHAIARPRRRTASRAAGAALPQHRPAARPAPSLARRARRRGDPHGRTVPQPRLLRRRARPHGSPRLAAAGAPTFAGCVRRCSSPTSSTRCATRPKPTAARLREAGVAVEAIRLDGHDPQLPAARRPHRRRRRADHAGGGAAEAARRLITVWSFRGAAGEPGTRAPRSTPETWKHAGFGSPLRSVRNDEVGHSPKIVAGSTRMRRPSWWRRVKPRRSKNSSTGIVAWRLMPVASRNWPTVRIPSG